MRKIFFIIIFTFFLSGCGEKERIYELENQNFEQQQEITKLKGVIEECNDNINYAKANLGGSYDEMESALDYLDDCEY